jgi:predicted dehydrogenase
MTDSTNDGLSRRAFVQTTAAATAGLLLPHKLPAMPAGAAYSDIIRVGIVGCGGRGTGAARDCMRASEGVEIVALGDLFPDRLAACRTNLANAVKDNPNLAAKLKVTDDRCFTGFDAYKKVIDSGVDLVMFATPPGFRPMHLAAAVAAGKHVFIEKPAGVDPTGVRSVLASAEVARQKELAIVAGTQRRHDLGYRATIDRVHAGAIGDVLAGEVYWNQGGLWMNARKPEWTDTEWQLRNWLYFTWLSGDHIVEQHMHNIDVANWVLRAHPVKAVGVGGRQWRTDPAYGHIYDHFAIDFEYPNGVHIMSMCRQIDGSADLVAEHFTGSKGSTDAKGTILGPSAFKYAGAAPNPYVQEHADLHASIRAGKPLNEGKQVAETTLSAIMGREAAYTGQSVSWDELLNAPQNIGPSTVAFGSLATPTVAMPGQTKLNRTWSGV